tara:strand:- start:958 stop:1911 length:954 start_codon:yes stop_codon:yes gene_type:complete
MKIKKKEKKIRVIIIGAGKIGREYLKILNNKKKFHIAAILATTYRNFKEVNKITKEKIFTTDTSNIFNKQKFDLAIIATPVDKTYKITIKVMQHVKTLLVEKPPALSSKEAFKLYKLSKLNKNNVFIALNRSFFNSTIAAKSILKNYKENRIVEVTDQENTFRAKKTGHKKIVLKKWMYANSIHMVDYFRIFCRGSVKKIRNYDKIKSTFDKKISLSKIFFSSGDMGVYKAFWNLPSKWNVKIVSESIFINLLPLEKITYSIKNDKIKELNLQSDDYKDGYLNQINEIEKFFLFKDNKLVTLKESLKTLNLIDKIYF